MTVRPARRRALAEAALALAIFGGAASWGARYWSASIAAGVEPIFYQEYFEPAVMTACGRGFGVSLVPLTPSLDRFINRRTDQFSCSDLPTTLELTDKNVRQKAMKYLLAVVSWTWRLTGRISWSGLGPLCGVFFGATTVLAYAIFRLAMPWWIALLGTIAMATSTLQLQSAPSLRDYGKAPFALASILLLGWLVKRWHTWASVLAISAAAGVVLGLGYGFRSDLLIYIPLFLLAVVLLLEGGVRRNLALKAAAAALFLVSFYVSARPILTAISTEGGCEWHVALLGFSTQFDDELNMQPGPYSVSYAYLDDFMYQSVAAYNARRGGSAAIAPCSTAYDAASRSYFVDIVKTLPADMIARAYASVRGMWDLPFRFEGPPLRDWYPLLYRARAKALTNLDWAGPAAVVAALAALAFGDARWAWAAILVLLYLGGYPALQSNVRHYFHLEFITWWAFGLIASIAAGVVAAARRIGLRGALSELVPDPRGAAVRVIACAFSVVAVLGTTLVAARWYQQRELRALFSAYIDAPKRSLGEAGAGMPPAFIEADVDAACTDKAVHVEYATTKPGSDFSWSFSLPRDGGAGVTQVFFPVYKGFSGATGNCVRRVSRVEDARRFPLLMSAVLSPGWEDRPLYQRIK